MKALIYVEMKDGKPIGPSLELFSAAGALESEADAILIGENLEAAAEETASAGGAAVLFVNGPAEPTEDYLTESLAQAVKAGGYDTVLLAATTVGKILTPRLAGRLGGGSVNDVTALRTEGGNVIAVRPVYGGTAFQELRIEASPAVVSVRGGSYSKLETPPANPAVPKPLAITVGEDALRSKVLKAIAEAGETVNIEDAKIVVAGGRGMGTGEGFALCRQLAEVLGGVVGATRPAIENGWVNRTHQVGQSGKIVAPDLYIACGISGSTQHLSGMLSSKYIVAINKDESAPIFSVANVGIVGDAKQVLPILIKELSSNKNV